MKLSDFLHDYEYRCRCCGKYPPQFNVEDNPSCFRYLLEKFDDLRRTWGGPLNVTSGYRCQRHNQNVGGAPLSAHLFGLALDICFGSPEEVARFVSIVKTEAPYMRIGWQKYQSDGKNLVHIDCAWFVWPRPTNDFEESVEW